MLKDFIQENKEAFEILSKEMTECGKITGDYDTYSVEARKCAIEIATVWLQKMYGKAYDNRLLPPIEEEPLYRSLDKEYKTD